MALIVTSTRTPQAPGMAVAGIYCMIPKESVAFQPATSIWAFHTKYYLSLGARNTEKVSEYFTLTIPPPVSQGGADTPKPALWTDAQYALAQTSRYFRSQPLMEFMNTTTDNLGITDPTNIDDAVTKIYAWVKANLEPTAVDTPPDSPIADLVNAYFIANSLTAVATS